MNPIRSAWSRSVSCLRSSRTRSHRPKDWRQRLCLELLEDRTVPSSVISIANATMDEFGSASVFVLPGSGVLTAPKDLVLGSDGNLYVASSITNSVIRYNGTTGALIGTFVVRDSGGLTTPYGLAFGPDGNLYVGSEGTNAIYRYNGTTGAFIDAFVVAGSGGLNVPKGIVFGADGNLYVSSRGTSSILRFQGPSGPSPGSPLPATGQTEATFVAAGAGGLSNPHDLAFGPGGHLYVASTNSNEAVLKFDGVTGNFISTYVATGVGGLADPRGLVFDQDGRLYVADDVSNAVHRYDNLSNFLDDPIVGLTDYHLGPVGLVFDSQGRLLIAGRDRYDVERCDHGVTVTLSESSANPVSVAYSTMDGTASAPAKYTAQSGTITFAPGQTSRLILLATHDESTAGGNQTFTVQLSDPTGGATIGTGSAVVTILDDEAKFYVVDSGPTATTYKYQMNGAATNPFTLGTSIDNGTTNSAPRGAAANAAGTTIWVLDVSGLVYVYHKDGLVLGSWALASLGSPKVQLEGIATNGTDIWILDSKMDKVYKLSGAATRTIGNQVYDSSFNLAGGKTGNTNGKGIVTDGTYLWVVDDGASSDKVFKYNLSGTLLGSWTIDAANSSPTGLTINPNNVSDIWIVDSGTKKVYQYTAAAGKTSGSQNAASSFALAAGNTNPQDIADPPGPGAEFDSRPAAPSQAIADGFFTAARFDATDDARLLDADAWNWFAERTPGNNSDAHAFSDSIASRPLQPFMQGIGDLPPWRHEAAGAVSATWESAPTKARAAVDQFFAGGLESYDIVRASGETESNLDRRR